jgi:hypothetical protein
MSPHLRTARTGLPRARRVAPFAPALFAGLLLAAAPPAARASSPVASPHGSFQAECSLCHGAQGWSPARISSKFDHASYGFALDGAHRAADCKACHQSLDFARAETACASCHLDPHRGELGAACEQCHTPKSFLDRAAMTRRHQETRFPLIGAHVAADCRRCHEPKPSGALQFVARDDRCQSCHLSDYRSATNPNHAGSGFSLQCESCHRAVTWHSAAFDHAGTAFPLTGAHRAVACASCHAGGVYAGTSPACVSCHQDDYDNTTNPIHVQMGFPTDCAVCHGTSNWRGSFAQHDALYFPIYSGAHRGRWSLCSDCHNQPSNFTAFNCLGCHPHSDQATTDQKHQGENGYQYASTACYSCHPQGKH